MHFAALHAVGVTPYLNHPFPEIDGIPFSPIRAVSENLSTFFDPVYVINHVELV